MLARSTGAGWRAAFPGDGLVNVAAGEQEAGALVQEAGHRLGHGEHELGVLGAAALGQPQRVLLQWASMFAGSAFGPWLVSASAIQVAITGSGSSRRLCSIISAMVAPKHVTGESCRRWADDTLSSS